MLVLVVNYVNLLIVTAKMLDLVFLKTLLIRIHEKYFNILVLFDVTIYGFVI